MAVKVATAATWLVVRMMDGLSSQWYKNGLPSIALRENELKRRRTLPRALPSLTALLGAKAGFRGPSPSFERAHLLLAFLTIGDTRLLGRQALARQTGLGEGAIRTILKRLREEGFADANAAGCYLTKSGDTLYKSIRRKLSSFAPVEPTRLTIGESQVALAVRGGGRAVKSGLEQRDSAIIAGAAGATTYVIKGGKFTVPGGSTDCEKDFPSSAWPVLRKNLKPANGDAVILCGSEQEISARVGALSAALTLL